MGGGQVMHGTLCQPSNPAQSDTIFLLVPGATYNSSYWDFPHDPATYSCREALNRAGYATIVVDRLGTGHSSRPASALVTITAQVHAVHEVIQALRHGEVGDRSYPRVLLGGHSLGSIIAMLEAGTFGAEDGTLLTGYTHVVNTEFVEKLATHSLYPAHQDKKFSGHGLDPGWLTTRPGTRGNDFHATPTSDPHVIAVDEENKDLVSTAEIADAGTMATGSSASLAIGHPVMIATGSLDQIFRVPTSSAAFEAQEQTFFNPQAQLRVMAIPGAGHDVALATNNKTFRQAVIAWANTIVA